MRDVKLQYIPQGREVTLHLSYEGKSLYQGRKVTLHPSYEGKSLYRGFSSLILNENHENHSKEPHRETLLG